jgi:hypothetical protein
MMKPFERLCRAAVMAAKRAHRTAQTLERQGHTEFAQQARNLRDINLRDARTIRNKMENPS